ncbi:MAG TPA: methylated-DNA--[protein]-cysteine S-methyltransferase [Verrucomicrobiota bacterium]|nr:methylated-DNA--[protein]-cysteine S-methyltransferase [Verrucomicrobiota bacterium]
MNTKSKSDLTALPIHTPQGRFVARYSVKGLAALEFPTQLRRTFVRRNTLPMTIRRWHRATAVALKRALMGRPPRMLPPLDLSRGTAFQQRVWAALMKIPRGQTRSYGEIARMSGNEKAARAVGGACGANPIPVFIPCHRVLAADHKLGGFSGGLEWKRQLLWREEAREWWG